eukprot:scaffold19927_cov65-Phaeocystis_antarctica.AAC.12
MLSYCDPDLLGSCCGSPAKNESKSTKLFCCGAYLVRRQCFARKRISLGDGRSYASCSGVVFSAASIASNSARPAPCRWKLSST